METRVVKDTALAARLAETARLTFAALGGSGYGRCDLRMDEAGDIYLLEINPNCAVFYPEGQFGSADFILASDPVGHSGFLEHLLACARCRRDRARKAVELRFDRTHGFRLFAARDISAGEIVERYENRLHVTMPLRRGEWRPLNHSCEPNLRPEGLHLAARRDIAAGEALTVDYQTLTDVLTETFSCHCGARNCRRIIQRTDH